MSEANQRRAGGRDPLFRGVGVALLTLFGSQGQVDAAATAEHAERLLAEGVRAILGVGTTGEAITLSEQERVDVLTALRNVVPAEVPLIAGTGAASAYQAERLTAAARDAGADAVLALSPPRSMDLQGYYERVAKAADGIPVLAYHFPAASSPGIDVDTLVGLPVHGVKDSSGEPARLLAILPRFDGDVFVGSAALLSYAGPLGCDGALLALANLEPRTCAAAFTGDAGAQLALADSHFAATRDFPRTLKRLLADRHGTSPASRL
ncbi:MAG: hypothetical protein GEU81_18260 [Nitriliruptorales bacterium]|nr:hypothetical protein [Nitriliruptorales bacterium]